MTTPTDFALVSAGVVEAVARYPVGPEVFGPEPAGEVVAFEPGAAFAGMLWDGETLSEPEAEEPARADPDQVPMWRVRVILAEDGILDAIDAAVQALPDPTVWERWRPGGAPNFVRDSGLAQSFVSLLGPSLGLDQAAVDAILIRAAALAE